MGYIEFDQSRPFDIVLLGRVAVDFNPVDYFQPLEECTTFKKYVGGSPANIAVGTARHGLKTGFFARVSDDQLGDFVTHFFEKEGIDTSRIRRCEHGEKIGLTFTEILSRDESSILMYRNCIADLQLNPADIDEEYIKGTKALLISGTSLAASPSREAALKAVMLAKRFGTRIIFDIDYRAYNWQSQDEISIYYSMVAKEADIIMGSREEFDLMERLIEPGRDDLQSAKAWHAHNAKIVIIKHGKKGSTAYTCDGKQYTVRPFPVEALKSFGGGDGYGAGFLYGLFHGWDMYDCLEFGCAQASMMVAAHSCSEDLPRADEVHAFIKASKEKYGDNVCCDRKG
ncbi:MAG: 5-dehydro-2-deoxygluconokinase [Lachnospiraceae bacterium]|nr:5-dehydro-2-deoxygluconokinase [Lachnospiraceae bacterium]